ncbi:phosphate/phosphite/phosphonate ABC transporter substrate-binding protein [Roseivirga sp. E12]|uniref:phosphate/phosphite/phosphonate ABC transporter substrate-binding protein n=1 Tax=Roseivirga sp. E12 TaxID=2819237 RepID=UPI001ABC5CA9|nr:PhnD/SsuA/transferrin family substrate-binding protein [Roseivirga sp. E12]MBO3697949.1 phosphate/phosphite/phosphonate ABC transporter substrate-binding protein [Roseivirga sp. E12]
MSFNYKLLFILILIFVCLVSCTPEKEPLTLATYTYHTNNRLENLKPLAELLQSKLDRPIHLKSYPDVASMLQGINSDSVDIGLINTLGYLKLSLDNRNMEVVAALRTKVEARDNYKTVILTNRTDIVSLKDLTSKAQELRMMFVHEGSTSGNLIPRLLLNSIGIQSPNTQFKNVSYGGNHTDTWKSLLGGQADICAIGSNEYYSQKTKNPAMFESLTALWISNEIPLGPVLLNNDLARETADSITEILLELHNTSPQALVSLKSGWSEALQAEKFYQINKDDYDSINTAFRENEELQLIFNQ